MSIEERCMQSTYFIVNTTFALVNKMLPSGLFSLQQDGAMDVSVKNEK